MVNEIIIESRCEPVVPFREPTGCIQSDVATGASTTGATSM
jgi:hypothetical protein